MALVLVFPVLAYATDAKITCQPVTTYEDGSAIPAGSAITYTLYGGLKGATKQNLANSTTCSFTRTNLSPGIQEWYLTATFGAESAPSVIVSKVVDSVEPPPPALLTSGTYSYCVSGTASAPTMTAIGYVTAGLSCGPTVRTVGSVKFCQITRAQADVVGWCTADKTLAQGIWSRAAP